MHLGKLPELSVHQPEAEIGLATDRGVGAKKWLAGAIVGFAKCVEPVAGLDGFVGGEFVPRHTVQLVKKMHHVDALIEFYGR
jgi:hypothetical protein